MAIAVPTTATALVDMGLWGSASRINAMYRLRVLGESRAVPPDVARVTTELKNREALSFGQIVSHFRDYDGQINEWYMRNRTSDLPALGSGQSVLDPLYRQYALLGSAPPVEPSALWYDMPQHLYLANRLEGVSDRDRALLQSLGYVEAARLGGDAYQPNADKCAEAAEKRAEIATTAGFGYDPEQAAKTPLVIPAIVWALGAVGVTVGVYACIKAWNEPAVAAQATTEAANAQLHQLNMIRAEETQTLLAYCEARLQSGQTTVAQCDTILGRLGEIEPPSTAPGGAGAESGVCTALSVLGTAGGVFAGVKLAKVLGLVK